MQRKRNNTLGTHTETALPPAYSEEKAVLGPIIYVHQNVNKKQSS